ncbi:MAG: glucose-6-phosphate isomerase [Thermoanaerobaculia bacterium]|nr:glucose-6-phosphate isomerase [Thermoanaerobaculia bacterium]
MKSCGSNSASWQRYRSRLFFDEGLGLRLDISRIEIPEDFFAHMDQPMAAALDAMAELENGAVANPDEDRMVGHYWLRAPELAPTEGIRKVIEQAVAQVKEFAGRVHAGRVAPRRAHHFTDLLVVGIGGSALGPQLAADALGAPETDRMKVRFFDNTDPDGMQRELRCLGDRLERTLTVVISKSGGTPETRNGMLVAKSAYEARGLDFAGHAVAVTGDGSQLDQMAKNEAWLARFPMWDWVGGRTSQTSAVGLLPAALQGFDIDALLGGARDCDIVTRRRDPEQNPAALLALSWHHATGGTGAKDMVILPYRDRLLLFSRYLQQLVMESLGKAKDLDGTTVAQGIAVYGNKGSTDQHAYVQQLREGVDNFFVTFLQVLEDGGSHQISSLEVEPGVTCGDYLRGFLLGTREALWQAGRQSLTVTVDRLDARTLGILIALYERAVGLYARLVNINAYHQPGVEAGKKTAAGVLDLQQRLLDHLAAVDEAQTHEQLVQALRAEAQAEMLFHLLEGLAANGRLERRSGLTVFESKYRLE